MVKTVWGYIYVFLKSTGKARDIYIENQVHVNILERDL